MGYYVKKERTINESILENNSLLSGLAGVVAGKKYRSVVIFATGSSANAAQSAYLFMQDCLKIPVYIKEPSIAMNYEKQWQADTLYIAISQGGRSYSTIELVKFLQENEIEVVVLTSDLESPIAAVGDHVLDLGMGIEEMPYVTAGYTATILVLWLIALEIAKNNQLLSAVEVERALGEIKAVVVTADTVIEATEGWFDQHRAELFNKKRYVFIGYGACYGVAKEAETKFTEVLHLPAHGHELEEYMHGPYLGLQADDALFLIDTAGKLSERMALLREFLEKHMTKTYLVTSGLSEITDDLSFDMPLAENLAPLVMTIPFHLVSYYISQEKGIDLTQSYYPDFDKITGSKI